MTFEIQISDLFRISCFGFRISDLVKTNYEFSRRGSVAKTLVGRNLGGRSFGVFASARAMAIRHGRGLSYRGVRVLCPNGSLEGRDGRLRRARRGADGLHFTAGAHRQRGWGRPTNEPSRLGRDADHGGALVCLGMVSTRTKVPSPQQGHFRGFSNERSGVPSA